MRWWTRLAACALVSLASGCATQALWEGAGRLDPIGASYAAPYERPSPEELLAARRTADGAHHLDVLMSDGRRAHYVVDGGVTVPTDDRPAGDPRAWPPVSAPASLPREEPSSPAPETGLPIEVGREPVAAPTSEPVPSMRLDGRKVVLTEPDGESRVIAEFPPPPPSPRRPPPRSVGPAQAAGKVVGTTVRLALTPVAVAADVVLGAGVVVGGVFLLPLLPAIWR